MRRARNLRARWLGRFLRGRLPDRNPLRRRIDRLETTIFAMLFIVVCATAPFVASAASGWEFRTSQRELRAQQATSHEIKATLLADAQLTGTYPTLTSVAFARFTAPDGRRVAELIGVTAGAKAGSVIWIWTNQSGRVIAPLLRTDIPDRDGLAAEAAVTCLVTVSLLAGLAVRCTLNRKRITAWGVDWRATEPRWNTRR